MSTHTRFNRIFSYFVIVLSIVLLIGSLLFFINADNEPIFSLFGIMLLGAAVFMLFAAHKTLVDSRKTELKEAQFEQAQNQQKESETILADWRYTPKEWHRTTRIFRRVNRSMELIVSLGIAALFIVLTFVFKDEGILLAGTFAAILYLIIRLAIARNIYRLKAKEATVVITRDFLVINGRYVHFADGHRFLQQVEKQTIRNTGFILFVIAWPTGKGFDNSIDIRIPTPPNQELEANALVSQLTQIHNVRS